MNHGVARRSLLGAALLGPLLLAAPPAALGEPHPWTAAQSGAPADPNVLPYYLARPIRQGSEVEFLGEIDFGAAKELRRALASAPAARVLHLNSPGGEIVEARQMAQLVRERGLITAVDKLCMSACPLVFLAGRQRYLAPGAKIGFHRFWTPGMSEAEMDPLYQPDRDFMQKAGVPLAFIDKAFATPSNSIWIPTDNELKAAGVVTEVTSKYLIKVDAFQSSLPERAELAQQILDAIKKYYPDRYQTIHAHLYQAMKSGNSEPGASPSVNSNYFDLLLGFMAHSSDRLAIEFLQALVKMMTGLVERNPAACLSVMHQSKSPYSLEPARDLPSGEAEQIGLAMLRAAADGAQRNAPLPSANDVAESLRLLAQEIKVSHAEDLQTLADVGSPAPDKIAVCKAQLHIFSAILVLPEAQQSALARHIYAAGMESEGPGAGVSTRSTPTELPRPFGIHPDK